jgi:hypothetical protein
MQPIDIESFTVKMLAKAGPLNSVDTQIFLKELIDERLGIFPISRFSPQRPLCSVAIHEAEDFTTHSLLEESLKVYIDYDIWEFFHLTLTEFLELPRDTIQSLTQLAIKKKESKNKLMTDIQQDIETKSKK